MILISADLTRRKHENDILAEIRLTPPRRARRRIAGLVMPWMLSRRILRCLLAPPLPSPLEWMSVCLIALDAVTVVRTFRPCHLIRKVSDLQTKGRRADRKFTYGQSC